MELYDLEQIPGSKDRTGRGTISFYWNRREQALKPLSRVASQMRACELSLERHDRHCAFHPKDQMAKERRNKLVALRARISPVFAEATDKLRGADKEYRRKMLEVAEVPSMYLRAFDTTIFRGGTITRSHTPKAEVNIIDNDGTVKILFGQLQADGTRTGCWLLYANGALHRERTPADIDRFARYDH